MVEAQDGSAADPEKRPWQDGSDGNDEKIIYNVCEKQRDEDNTRVLEFNLMSVLLCLMF